MYQYNATVLKIVDGDTLDVNIDCGFNIHIIERVRLYGINAYESRTSNPEEKVKGLAAKKFTEEHIPVNSKVLLNSKKYDRDKYGRVLAEIILGDFNLNEQLLKNGHAVVFMAD